MASALLMSFFSHHAANLVVVGLLAFMLLCFKLFFNYDAKVRRNFNIASIYFVRRFAHITMVVGDFLLTKRW